MQKGLFRATALSSTETFAPLGKIANPLIGITAKLPDTCKCGSPLAVIGPAVVPHRASLHCQECRSFADGCRTRHSGSSPRSCSSANRLSRSLFIEESRNRKIDEHVRGTGHAHL